MINKVNASLSEKVLLIFLIFLFLITFGSYFLLKDKCLFVKNVNFNKINFTNVENIAIMNVECGDVVIELDPITFIAEVPETEIKKVINGQQVSIELVTGEVIKSKLSFVSKSASASTRTFRVEAKVSNASGKIRDGITGTMTIQTNKVLANKISPSILLLSDEGDLGVRAVNENDEVKFLPIKIIEDTNDGIWVTGIPNLSKLIVLGQGFVKNGEKVQTTFLSDV